MCRKQIVVTVVETCFYRAVILGAQKLHEGPHLAVIRALTEFAVDQIVLIVTEHSGKRIVDYLYSSAVITDQQRVRHCVDDPVSSQGDVHF